MRRGQQRECLSEEEVLDYLEQRMSTMQRALVEEHLDSCSSCRQLVALSVETIPQDAQASAEESSADFTQLAKGTRIDHFEVVEFLGEGAMGEVYRAQDLKLRREVALKLIHAHLLHSQELKERFLFEARATAQLNHPNIVSIYSTGLFAERPYLALEYVSGMSLRGIISAKKPSVAQSFRWFEAMISGLQEAHQRGLCHRDLKPDNIIIAEDGSLKILDFGLAKAQLGDGYLQNTLELSPSGASSTTIKGTPAYMAPEQWRSRKPGPAADIWAAGVIFFECLAGARPYQEADMIAYAVAVCEAKPVPLPPLDIPEPLEKLLMACLQKDAELRPSAQGLQEELSNYRNHAPLDLALALEESAAKWSKEGRTLWEGPQLDQAKVLLSERAFPLSPPASRFLSASLLRSRRHFVEAQLKTKKALLGSLLMALVLAGMAFYQSQQKQKEGRQRRALQQKRSQELLLGSQNALEAGRWLESRALLRSAAENYPPPDTSVMWWQLKQQPLFFERDFGTGIYQMALSPDGKKLAVAAQNKSVYLADTDSFSQQVLRGHQDQVHHLAFSEQELLSVDWSQRAISWSRPGYKPKPLGKIVSAGQKLSLIAPWQEGQILWTRQGEVLYRQGEKLRQLAKDVVAVDVGKDSLNYLSASGELMHCRSLDGCSMRAALKMSGKKTHLLVAADQVLLSDDRGILRWYQRRGEDLRLQLSLNTSGLTAWALHAAQQKVYWADKGGNIFSYSLKTKQRQLLGSHQGKVSSLLLDSSRSLLYSGGLDGRLLVFNTKTALQSLPPPRDGQAELVASPDGKYLASAGYDQSIHLWSAESGELVASQKLSAKSLYSLDFSPDGRQLAAVGRAGEIYLVDSSSLQLQRTIGGHKSLYAVTYSSDGEYLAVASRSGEVRLYHGDSWQLQERWHLPGAIFTLAFSPGGRALVAAGKKGQLFLLQPGDKTAPQSRQLSKKPLWKLRFSPDGQHIYVVGYQGDLWQLSWPDLKAERLFGQDGKLYALAVGKEAIYVAGAQGIVHRIPLSREESPRQLSLQAEINGLALIEQKQQVFAIGDHGLLRALDQAHLHQRWTPAQGFYRSEMTSFAPKDSLQALKVAVSEQILCQLSKDQRLSAYSLVDGKKLYTTPVKAVRGLAAVGEHCLLTLKDSLRSYGPEGHFDTFPQVCQLSGSKTEPLLLCAGQLYTLNAGKPELLQAKFPAGVTAVLKAGQQLYWGFQDGRIESSSEQAPNMVFHPESSAPVTALLMSSLGQLVSGQEDGSLTIYSNYSGRGLWRSRLRGAVEQLWQKDSSLWANSSLGQSRMLEDVFRPPDCALRQGIDRSIPVVWQKGRVVAQAPPENSCGKD